MSIKSLKQLQVDVFGPCNLRCPTCLIGCGDAQTSRRASKGLMSVDTFSAILDKAVAEMPNLRMIGMHNWTEPLLHPQLPELIRAAKQRSLYVYISSNLNVLRREDALLGSGLDRLAVSLSGFSQEKYGVYHAGGKIDAVKANMEKLAATKQRTGAEIDLLCIFHRYRDNRTDERQMRRFSKGLGFRFIPVWAYFTPVEKILASQSPDQTCGDVAFTEADRAISERLAISTADRLRAARAQPAPGCVAQTQQLPIDVNGDVVLCCGVGLSAGNYVGNFLDTPLADIQDRRESHSMCNACGKCGIPTLYHGIPADTLDRMGRAGQAEFESGGGAGPARQAPDLVGPV